MGKVIVIFSGGQDSTACLLMAINQYSRENVVAISFIYDGKYRKDIECAKKICEELNVKHIIYDIGIIHKIANSNNIEGRNLLLLSFATIYAQKNGINNIMIGLAKDDITGEISHPDCSIEFIKSMEETLKKATNYNINIITPLISLSKSEIWKKIDELGYLNFVEKKTYSCYSNNEKHCMNCAKCDLRFKSLMKYKKEKEQKNKINIIEWNKINQIVSKLSNDIKQKYEPDIILSVVRGGMIPSVMLSHQLNIREVENIVIKETINDSINAIKNIPQIDENNNLDKIKNRKVLIVDDIVGGGETLRKLKDYIKRYNPKEVKTAICFINKINWDKQNKESYENTIDFLGEEIEGWVVFPWEERLEDVE